MKKEITLIELKNAKQVVYKVTRRILELNVAETKRFYTKEEAIKQFNEWSEN